MRKHPKELSLFQLMDRQKFDELAKKWKMDKGVRNFSTWEMTQALLYGLVLRLNSFREIEAALGIPDSTFGDALRKRQFGFFQELCDLILFEIRGRTESRKIKRAIRQVMAIDSSEIRVHGGLFAEPGWKQKHTISHKAAGKLHVVWDIDGQWVDDFLIEPGRRADSIVSLELRLLPGKMYVFDRGYNDFDFWQKVVLTGSDFVSRLKACPRNRALQKKVLQGRKYGILYDGAYVSTSPAARNSKIKLRQIIYRDRLTKKLFHFVTSDRRSNAKTIAEIYKKRWAVELLFRWLKGHLDIRYLPTKTSNAVKIQVAMAVLVQLLLQLKRVIESFKGSLWDLLRSMRMNLIRRILAHAYCGPPNGCRWMAPTPRAAT